MASGLELVAATLGGVLGGGALAVVAQEFWSLVRRPKIRLLVNHEPACEALTPIESDGRKGEGKWLRIIVVNDGCVVARSCQVLMTKISRRAPTGVTMNSEKFGDNLPLIWSLSKGSVRIDLLPGIEYTVDALAALSIGEKSELTISTPDTPFRYADILAGIGDLEIEVIVASENSSQKRITICAQWDGTTPSLSWKDVVKTK